MVYVKKNLPSRYWVKDDNGNIDRFNYNRECLRDRMVDRLSVPCISTSIKYGFTEEDLVPLFDRYLEIVKSGVVPAWTQQKRYPKKKVVELDNVSEISETDTEDSFF